jgi:hypothetical protein
LGAALAVLDHYAFLITLPLKPHRPLMPKGAILGRGPAIGPRQPDQTMSHLVERTPVRSSTTDGGQSYLVGLSVDGQWLAVETRGLGGGIFRSQRDALAYAAFETGRRPNAVTLSPHPIVFTL